MISAIEYHLIRRTEELIEFLPQWQALFARDPKATPFQSPEWLLPWWKEFGSDELCAVTISREGGVVGFLPFYVYRDAAKRQRQLLPLGIGTTDYLDGVFAPECSAEEIEGSVEWLRGEMMHDVFCATQLPGWSRLLEELRTGSGIKDQGAGAAGDRGVTSDQRRTEVFVSQSEPCSRMKAVAMTELPQKVRRNAMYYRNRAQRCGVLELVTADETNWEKIFTELVRLHTRRWRERGEEGVLVDERVVAWHRQAIPLLLRTGLLRLMALRLNEETIAVLYSLVDSMREGRTQYFYITAFSPEHAELRPGTLLIAYAVEHAAHEGVATIDMLRGEEGYKQIWHMEKVPTWCCTQFAAASLTDSDREESAA